MLRYASVLIKKVPQETLLALTDEGFREINIAKLMASLMNVPSTHIKNALHFIVNNCIYKRKSKEKSVHNLAFYFYSKLEKTDELITFLLMEEQKKIKGHTIYFEVDYALNLCK